MQLLNKYQSRTLQCALELLARLEAAGSLSRREAEALVCRSGMEYAGQLLTPLCRAGVLVLEQDRYRLSPEAAKVRLAPGRREREFLHDALESPEVALFLQEETRQRLLEATEPGSRALIQQFAPRGEELPEQPGPEGFRTLLEAIRTHRLIQYTYKTRSSDGEREAVTVPWKVEYSAYDRRWWVILYDREQDRTIKARLDNLRNIRMLGPSGVADGAIDAAMERLLEPEPVELEVERKLGALERCFLVFENQLFEETEQLSEERFRLRFRFYRFDRGEILRRLLYLGPTVRLIGPASLRQELRALLDRALEP